MARRFNKFGLRRDLNFADLANPQQSLNNILNGLVDVQGESFISQDLDAIRDIRATSITNDDFRNIAGAALRVTDNSGSLVVYTPVVKFKNRLDIAKFTIGEPNFWGGDGLTTRYYNSTQINSGATNVNDIFTGTEQVKEVFWERGIFNFIAKINDKFNDSYGGIRWDGYFRPTVSGVWRFAIDTTAFYTLEFDDGSGNLQLIGRKSAIDTSIVAKAETAGIEWVSFVTVSDIQKVLIGDVVIHPTIPQFADTSEDNYATAVTVTDIDRVSGRVKLSSALEANLPANTTLTFRHRIGDTKSDMYYITYNLEQFKTYKIRMRFWLPNIAGVTPRAEKSFVVTCIPPNSTKTYLNYRWLYSEEYNIAPTAGTSDYGDFRSFYFSRLNDGGGTVGGNTFATYRSVVSKSPLTVSYSPPTSYVNIVAKTKVANTTNGANILPMSLTDGIAVGQYIFGSGVPDGTRVKEISINEGVFMTQNATASASTTLTFIDHRGLVTYQNNVTTTGGSKSVTVSANTYNAVSTGDILVSANLPQYTFVTRKDASNALFLSNAFENSGTQSLSVVNLMFFFDTSGSMTSAAGTYNGTTMTHIAAAKIAAKNLVARYSALGTTKVCVVDTGTSGMGNVGYQWTTVGSANGVIDVVESLTAGSGQTIQQIYTAGATTTIPTVIYFLTDMSITDGVPSAWGDWVTWLTTNRGISYAVGMGSSSANPTAGNQIAYDGVTNTNLDGIRAIADSDLPTPVVSITTNLYFYRSKGIVNNTLSTYCNDVVSAPTVAQSNAGSNTLTLAYVDGIGVNDRPQFGSRIPSGTTVTNVNATTKVVTLSAAITDDIPPGQLVTFAPAGTTDNKELCFPPIDTSPPFTATAVGLTSTSARPSLDIRPVSGTSELKFVGLSADGVTVTTATPTATYTRSLRIRDRSGAEFRILATT